MKKLLSVAALLMIALLFFTGCAKDADPNALPGAWTSTVQLNTSNRTCWNNKGSLVYNNENKAFVFTLNAGELTGDSIPSNNSFNTWVFPTTTDTNYTGFKATVSTTSGSYCGFFFNCTTNDTWSYYYLILSNGSFMLKQRLNNNYSTIAPWTPDAAIKAAPQENEVIVYKNTDSSIVIKINGVTVYTITAPQLHEGQCGVICCVSDTNYNNGTEITTTWKFKEFQR